MNNAALFDYFLEGISRFQRFLLGSALAEIYITLSNVASLVTAHACGLNQTWMRILLEIFYRTSIIHTAVYTC